MSLKKLSFNFISESEYITMKNAYFFSIRTSDEAVWQMQTPVHDLAPSIYSYRVMVGDETRFIRFVKL